MIFTNTDKKITEENISEVESEIGLKFPEKLKELFLFHNGGEPEPYSFINDEVSTLVNETLPLASEVRGTALDSYRRLVLEKGLMPKNFFPFAVDPGGDYFVLDCVDEGVHFFSSDKFLKSGNGLVSLGLSLSEFWNSLEGEL